MKRRLKINLCSWQQLSWADMVGHGFFPIPRMFSFGVTKHQSSHVVAWPAWPRHVQLKALQDLYKVKCTFFALTCSAPFCTDLCNFDDMEVLASRFLTMTMCFHPQNQPCIPGCTCRIMCHYVCLSFEFARLDLLIAGYLSRVENYRKLMVYRPSY